MPWTYDGLSSPPYQPRPAVSAAYGAEPPPKAVTLYLRTDRRRLRSWSSPDPDKLNRFVDRLDAMTDAEAEAFMSTYPRKAE